MYLLLKIVIVQPAIFVFKGLLRFTGVKDLIYN